MPNLAHVVIVHVALIKSYNYITAHDFPKAIPWAWQKWPIHV